MQVSGTTARRRASSSKKTLISVVVPVYNEQPSLPTLYKQLKSVATKMPQGFEFIFVDDGSSDGSRATLATFEAKDSRVRVVEFSRNFGKEIAITAGLHAARGSAAIMIDADLQYPVELIPEFVAAWRDGAEVVVGVRTQYDKESIQKKFNSWLYYKVLSTIADTPVTPRATDYRLLDKVVIDAFNELSERNRMTRGLIDWLGFRREYIDFQSSNRLHGKATYGSRKLVRLAINSFVSLSLVPLRLAGWLGVVITFLAASAGLFIVIEDFVLGDPLNLNFSGPAMLAILNMFWIGIVLIALGLVALYIASIHAEVINRPLYVIRPSKNNKPR